MSIAVLDIKTSADSTLGNAPLTFNVFLKLLEFYLIV